MRRLLLLLFLFASPFAWLPGQSTLVLRPTLQVGYAALDSLNGVLQRYNDRSAPDEPMQAMNLPVGPSLSLALAADKAFFEVGSSFQWVGSKSVSSPTQNTQEYLTKVRNAYYMVNLGAAFRIHEMIAAGVSLDLGTSILKLKRGYKPEISTTQLRPVSRDVVLGGSAFLQLDIPLDDYFSIGIRPFYHYNFIRSDYGLLNRNLNFGSYLQDNAFILGGTGQAGIRIGLGMWMR